ARPRVRPAGRPIYGREHRWEANSPDLRADSDPGSRPSREDLSGVQGLDHATTGTRPLPAVGTTRTPIPAGVIGWSAGGGSGRRPSESCVPVRPGVVVRPATTGLAHRDPTDRKSVV